MEDPTGFMRYPRHEAGKQLARVRVRHWHEYEKIMPLTQATIQSRRCMDCGTPHCHSFCPVHNLIPDWNSLVSEDDWHATDHDDEGCQHVWAYDTVAFTGHVGDSRRSSMCRCGGLLAVGWQLVACGLVLYRCDNYSQLSYR